MDCLRAETLSRQAFAEALWLAAVTDSVACAAAMTAKAAVVAALTRSHAISQSQSHSQAAATPGKRIGNQTRALRQALVALEYAFLAVRSVLPAPLWARFFLSSRAYGRLCSSAATGVYLSTKLALIADRLEAAAVAARLALRADVHFGVRVAPEEMARTIPRHFVWLSGRLRAIALL